MAAIAAMTADAASLEQILQHMRGIMEAVERLGVDMYQLQATSAELNERLVVVEGLLPHLQSPPLPQQAADTGATYCANECLRTVADGDISPQLVAHYYS